MKPLIQLNNVARARLLFELFPQEIPAFLEFLKAITDNLVRDPDQLKEKWENQFFEFNFWIRLATDTQKVLNKHGYTLSSRSRLFADQLFGGYLALYAAHCLHQYILHGHPTDKRFTHAVEEFFK
jgi:hypothetical protein